MSLHVDEEMATTIEPARAGQFFELQGEREEAVFSYWCRCLSHLRPILKNIWLSGRPSTTSVKHTVRTSPGLRSSAGLVGRMCIFSQYHCGDMDLKHVWELLSLREWCPGSVSLLETGNIKGSWILVWNRGVQSPVFPALSPLVDLGLKGVSLSVWWVFGLTWRLASIVKK